MRPCHMCGKMPWACKCNPARRSELTAAFLPRSESTADPLTEPQISAELFQRMSERAGIWGDAEEAEHRATKLRDRSRSPSPEPEDKEAWECPECHSLNSRHELHCRVATCGSRRPLVQEWRPGDYYCEHCGNHRFRLSRCQNYLGDRLINVPMPNGKIITKSSSTDIQMILVSNRINFAPEWRSSLCAKAEEATRHRRKRPKR